MPNAEERPRIGIEDDTELQSNKVLGSCTEKVGPFLGLPSFTQSSIEPISFRTKK